MSSARPDPAPAAAALASGWRRSPYGVRLALGYAALFALSAAALLGLAYATLGWVLERQDASFLRDQLRAVERVYTTDGVEGVRRHAAALHADDRGEEVLVRVTAPDGADRLLVLPDEWVAADLRPLGSPLSAGDGLVEIVNVREDQELWALTRRLPSGDAVQVGISSDERDDVLEAFPRVFGYVALPLLLLALLGGLVMANAALRPVRRIVGTLEAIARTGDVRERAPVPAERGEFADVLGLFNRMLDRIEGLVGRLRDTLDDVAHDLRTPLTALRGTAEVALARDREPEAYREALGRVVEAAGAAQATLDAVLDVAEAEAGALALDLAPLDVDDLAHDVADLYGLVADEKGVALTVEVGGAGAARGDRQRLRRALANLVDNAVKYTPPGGRVVLTTGRAGAEAWVRVHDTGPGIAPDELPRIWDRLYRSDRTRHERGLGLGLGLARAVAEAHGGRVVAESAVGEGSTFTLAVPAGDAPPGPPNLSDL
jgi:heavy metal sensor kinase